jgi:predicted  nucleic acid-binding Zn-ribbon protein
MPDAQDLPKLQADYKNLQDDIAALQEKAAAIQVQLRLTETQLAEIANATNGYDKSATDMQHELDADQKAIGKKRPTAEFKVKDLKGAIDKKIIEFDAALEDQAKGVAAAAKATANSSAAADRAEQVLQDKQSAFTALKNKPKALQGKIQDIKTLITEITKAEVQDDAVAMYFYVSEAASLAKDVTIPRPDDYENQLVAAQSGAEDAKTAAAAKKADSDKAATAGLDTKKAYDAALASRRTDLLKALREVKAPPAP